VDDVVYKQDLYRVEHSLRANDFQPAEVKEAMDYYGSWLAMARTGTGFERLEELTNAAKGKKWFEWVEAPARDDWIWHYYLKTGNYNALQFWKDVRIPVLLVYGENDQIEDVRAYLTNIDHVLIGQAHNRDVTELILPRAQHNLCIFPEKGERFFWWHIAPGYEDLIASWIRFRAGS
jgi:pimeloyl-ACP methyl ester carboxylesterase